MRPIAARERRTSTILGPLRFGYVNRAGRVMGAVLVVNGCVFIIVAIVRPTAIDPAAGIPFGLLSLVLGSRGLWLWPLCVTPTEVMIRRGWSTKRVPVGAIERCALRDWANPPPLLGAPMFVLPVFVMTDGSEVRSSLYWWERDRADAALACDRITEACRPLRRSPFLKRTSTSAISPSWRPHGIGVCGPKGWRTGWRAISLLRQTP